MRSSKQNFSKESTECEKANVSRALRILEYKPKENERSFHYDT